MSTFTQIYYHLVFATKARERVLVEKNREEFFRYTWGIIKNKDSHLEYIKNQQEHHRIRSFREELRELLVEAGVQFDEKYLD